ncbi:Holliday junction resolvase RuvX [Minwuia thermotolerans]|uniref:Putative pre-16S rRNA nuclease n=1 Tax=Minwuia thermotolerans TaxID=2056226 RepID=A0A2M9G5K1_9PROT|nr:Holliday junction resolvase RuvX [Minwuia thermotolerans]PJK30993.1 Holliday junction resolvase RuvX [Minwuia thermotolerans]
MLLESAARLKAACAGRRLLGLDPGTKTIGVAVADPGHQVATPLTVIRRTKFTADLAALQALIAEYDIGGLVIGLPLNMDGTAGPRAQSVRAFQRNLESALDLPMILHDERMSTQAVERSLIGQDVSRRRRAEVIDAHAAAYILQGVLDARP